MTYYAAIDIGSNSVRLLVGRVEGTQVQPLARELRSTRILAGATDGWLQESAVKRTVAAVAELTTLAREYAPAAMVCVATSAVREARNPETLTEALEKKTGLALTIIDGTTEAGLAYRGALAGLKETVAAPAVIDIGGGSTEICWQGIGGIQLTSSPIGAVRVKEVGLSRPAIKQILYPVLMRLNKELPGILIGTGGTITTVAAMELGLSTYNPDLIHGMQLTAEQVKIWSRRLALMTLAEKKNIPGLHPERADIIAAGVTIMEIILDGLKAEGLMVSEADLLWGLLLAQAQTAI